MGPCFLGQHGQSYPDPELRLQIMNNGYPDVQMIPGNGGNCFLPPHIGFSCNPESCQMAGCPRSCNPG